MAAIAFKTKYLTYEITEDGKNKAFRTANGEDRLIASPAAVITLESREQIPSVGASFDGGILSLSFADGTEIGLSVEQKAEYITFTLCCASREDFLSVSFLNVSLADGEGAYEAVMMGMTLATQMKEHPGDNRALIASAYPHIGLLSTARSTYPAKVAFFAAPKAEVRRIEREILEEIPKTEFPRSMKGGPYANLAEKEARGDYFILMQESATLENVDSIIAEMRRFGLTQITLHHYAHYLQGDFGCRSTIPGGMEEFKKVVARFHENGILVGLQSYSFFVVPDSSYVTPVPHKDLDILRSFTLAEDLSASADSLAVLESTEGITAEEGFVFVNSPYLWIDDELIRFSLAENGRFRVAERGAYGTRPAEHKKGSEIRHLKQYFLIPLARVGSELFYEIARKTAEFYNESGADYFYLDALDGAFVLDGEDYVWYHAMDFVREMFAHIKRDIIFDCCYNPQYTGTWYVRSRYGAIDVSLNSHRACVDAHLEYNKTTADRMGITPELGWFDLFPREGDPERWWINEDVYPEDLEYLCAKTFATRAALAYVESFRKHGNLPCAEPLAEILRKYAALRKEKEPTPETENYLRVPENGAALKDGKLVRTRASYATFEQGSHTVQMENTFAPQIPSFRLQALRAAADYDHPSALTIAKLDENAPLPQGVTSMRFEAPANPDMLRGLGVWCKGDGSGALIVISLRNLSLCQRRAAEHYIKADFVGWRYFAFYENQNATLPTSVWPRKELGYVNYNHLQEFYGYYRTRLNYQTIDGIDITVVGSDAICLRDLRLLPHVNRDIVNPTLHFGDKSMKIEATLPVESNLYFDGKECVLQDSLGNVLARPAFSASPEIPSGTCEVSLFAEENSALVRARLTLITEGDPLTVIDAKEADL